MAKYDYLKGRIIEDRKNGHLALITQVNDYSFKKKLLKKGKGYWLNSWTTYGTPYTFLYTRWAILDLDNPAYLIYDTSI